MSRLTVLEILSIALSVITLMLLFTIAFAYIRSKFVLANNGPNFGMTANLNFILGRQNRPELDQQIYHQATMW